MRRVVGAIVLGSLLAGVLVPVRPWTDIVGASAGTQTDILDVQRIVSGILEPTDPDTTSDVNGDGEVNILDFQSALNGMALVERTPGPVGGRPEGKQAVLVQVLRFFDRAPARSPILPVPNEASQVISRPLCADIFSLALLKERCLVSLPPHAPPAEIPEQYA